MDYENLYKNALSRAINAKQNTESAVTIGILEEVFPELKESEDEKARKELLKFLEGIWHLGKNAPFEKWDKSDCSKWIAWLEKQGESHISHDDEIMIKQLTEYFTTGHGLQNTNETVVEWLNDVKEKLEKQAEVVSDKDDIEAEEKGIRKAFNKIWEEKQDKQKSQRMISAEAKEAMYAKTAWSEEDEKTIHNIDAAIRHEVVFPIDELKSMEIWLESLKYRIRPKHEWKRDEKMFQLIEDVIDVYRKTQGSVIGGIHTEELKDYLKSLRPQNTWKPSDEQMAILYKYAEQNNYDGSILTSLYNELLKKLREE